MFHQFQHTKDPLVDNAHRVQKMKAAELQRLAQFAQGNEENQTGRHIIERRILIFVASIIFLLVVAMFASSQPASAQGIAKAEPGDYEPFPSAILAYRLATYYAAAGDYERAIEEYERAIEEFPAELFTIDVTVAAIYWQLGDAQRLSGDEAAALISYHQFLDLAGDMASEFAFERVAELENNALAEVASDEMAG